MTTGIQISQQCLCKLAAELTFVGEIKELSPLKSLLFFILNQEGIILVPFDRK
jgi:hypothetical protein